MSKVPAWKKLGLAVKKDVENDVLKTTEHLGDEVLTNKAAKKLARKRSESTGSQTNKQKKPPKRQKVPKAERKAPPEKDQLSYLKQFSEDRDNWKFSKQKQNWLLKNIEHIPSNYDVALRNYVDSIQGGARTRLQEQLTAVVNEWNTIAKKLEEKIEAELYGDKGEETIENDKEQGDEKKEDEAKEEEKPTGPSREYVLRCKMLLDTLQDDPITLVGIEESVIDTISLDDGSETKDEGVSEENLIIEEIDVEDYVKEAKSD